MLLSTPRKSLTPGTMRLANVGKKYWHATIRDVPDSYQCKATILWYVNKIIEHTRDGIGLILTGPKGHGKTHIAVSILKKVLAHRGRGLFLPTDDLVDVKINKTSGQMFEDEEVPIFERACRADLLVLDDLGAEHTSEFDKRTVEQLIRRRSRQNLSTIYTTNLNRKDLATVYGDWIDSVTKEDNVWVLVNGKDWREERHRKLKDRVKG